MLGIVYSNGTSGKRSKLQKSERQNSKRTLKIFQSIRTSKVSISILIKVIRTSKIENINYLWHINQYTRACGVLGQGQIGQVRLGQAGLSKVRLSYVNLGQARLGYVRLSQVRLGQVKKAKGHRYVTFDLLIFLTFDVLINLKDTFYVLKFWAS